MREFTDKIDAVFKTGLRRYHKTQHGAYQFYDLYNLKPTKFGLVPYEPVVCPIPPAILNAFGLDAQPYPFPQMFIGNSYIFICAADKVYVVDPDDWSTLMPLATYDAESPLVEKDITISGAWEFADFWESWFLTNGRCTVFSCGKDIMVGGTYKVYIHDGVPIQCACAHKGRVLYGGFDYTQFWNSTWQTFWNSWFDTQDTDIIATKPYPSGDAMMPVGENWIWWSSIGGGDALFLFFPSTVAEDGYITSSYGATKPFLFDLMKKNESGFAPMPFQGQVLAMRPLGDFIVVYGEGGVAAIKPVASPTPTYSIKRLNCGGLASRGAVNGDDSGHVFLDNSGMFNRITPDLQVSPLGFRECGFDMLGAEVQISHSPNRQTLEPGGEFYITDGTHSYYLSGSELSETAQVVMSADYFGGATVGFASDMGTPASKIARFGLDRFDLGLSGIKTIEWVRFYVDERVWADDGIDLQVAIDHRYTMSHDDSWKTTGWKKVNKEGVVFFPTSGVEFRIKATISDYQKLDIINGEIGFKHDDKRYTRGISLSSAISR